jgi:hypothetical protein
MSPLLGTRVLRDRSSSSSRYNEPENRPFRGDHPGTDRAARHQRNEQSAAVPEIGCAEARPGHLPASRRHQSRLTKTPMIRPGEVHQISGMPPQDIWNKPKALKRFCFFVPEFCSRIGA